MAVKKQFIAGAICPSCQQQDTLVLCAVLGEGEETASQKYFACVSCGYQENMTPEVNSKSTGTKISSTLIPVVTISDNE
jgi:uncharacterized metal-binding protein (TIGR02443 family)